MKRLISIIVENNDYVTESRTLFETDVAEREVGPAVSLCVASAYRVS